MCGVNAKLIKDYRKRHTLERCCSKSQFMYVGTFICSDQQKECPICEKIIFLGHEKFKTFYSTFKVRNSIKSAST